MENGKFQRFGNRRKARMVGIRVGLIEPSRGIYDASANGRSGQIYARGAGMAAQLATNELGPEDKS